MGLAGHMRGISLVGAMPSFPSWRPTLALSKWPCHVLGNPLGYLLGILGAVSAASLVAAGSKVESAS